MRILVLRYCLLAATFITRCRIVVFFVATFDTWWLMLMYFVATFITMQCCAAYCFDSRTRVQKISLMILLRAEQWCNMIVPSFSPLCSCYLSPSRYRRKKRLQRTFAFRYSVQLSGRYGYLPPRHTHYLSVYSLLSLY